LLAGKQQTLFPRNRAFPYSAVFSICALISAWHNLPHVNAQQNSQFQTDPLPNFTEAKACAVLSVVDCLIFSPATQGSTPRASKTFQPQRCGLTSINDPRVTLSSSRNAVSFPPLAQRNAFRHGARPRFAISSKTKAATR
jgi:hypothetical protein